MKSDARLLLNRKKQNASSGLQNRQWKNQNFKSHRVVDARSILNVKRNQKKSRTPQLGTFMRTKTEASFIASQIKKEISPNLKQPWKDVQLSNDGNIIITAKSKNPMQILKRNPKPEMDFNLPSSSRTIQRTSAALLPTLTDDMDDLEQTAIEDLLDVDALPPSYVSSKTFPAANLSRNSYMNQVLAKSKTMIADQVTIPPKPVCAKVYVSNLHPSVTLHDLMELFGDVGVMESVEMLSPGTAIINFDNAEDAERACETYNNRLLDGMPMKCYLQAAKPQAQRTAISQRLGNRLLPGSVPAQKTSALITPNPRSRYNSRNVQFTVKLA